MKAFSIALVLTVAAVLPLAAQQPGGMGGGMMRGHGVMQGMGMNMDSIMAPMMRAMASAPGHLLMEKRTLHLTAEQETQLTALRDSAKAAHDAAADQAMMHMGEMEQALHVATPDRSQVKAHFDAAQGFMHDAMWAMVRSAAEARAVLTDAQRKQVDEMAARPMRRGGMMRH